MPEFSVIVPCYNTEAYLGEAIESCLAQTVRDLEVIVVDDGSTDGSAAVAGAAARRDSRVQVIHQRNAGVGAARNAGLAVAQGAFVSFLDADDLLEPEKLAVQGRVLTDHPGIDVALCDGSIIDATGAMLWERLVQPSRFEGHPALFDMFFELGPFPPLVPLLRRETALAAGGFDPDPLAQGWCDVGFWMHVAANGADYRYIPQRLVRYRQNPSSMTANHEAMDRSRQIIFAKMMAERPVESARALMAVQKRLCAVRLSAEESAATHRAVLAERDALRVALQHRTVRAESSRQSPPDVWTALLSRFADHDSTARPLVIWGAGAAGQSLLTHLRTAGCRPSAFVDSDPAKSGTLVDGIPVQAPGGLRSRGDRPPFILVASVAADQIEERLVERGWRPGLDYLIADRDLLMAVA